MIDRVLREDVLRQVHAHALREYPHECCGMILETGEVRECENAMDRFHAADPEAFPRTKANGYCLDFDDLAFLNESFDRDVQVVAIYHSHPDGAATFSAADREAAMPDGVPLYPTLLHVIVAVDVAGVRETRCFGFTEGAYLQLSVWRTAGA